VNDTSGRGEREREREKERGRERGREGVSLWRVERRKGGEREREREMRCAE